MLDWSLSIVKLLFINRRAIDFHSHLMTCLIMMSDILISRMPYRFLHFVYSSLFSICYVTVTLVCWLLGRRDRANVIIDWQGLGFSKTMGNAVLFSIVGHLGAHSIGWGLYQLRLIIAKAVKFLYMLVQKHMKSKERNCKFLWALFDSDSLNSWSSWKRLRRSTVEVWYIIW